MKVMNDHRRIGGLFGTGMVLAELGQVLALPGKRCKAALSAGVGIPVITLLGSGCTSLLVSL